MERSADAVPIDLPRRWRLSFGRLRRAFRERSRQVVEAGESGERLVARVRLVLMLLLALIQLTPLLESSTASRRASRSTVRRRSSGAA